jgi:hypothetical protein
MRSVFVLAVVLATFAMSACGDEDAPETPTGPTTPATVTSTFTGTITRNGAATHFFNASTTGTVTATLTSLSPNPEIVVGFALGTSSSGGTVCNVVLVRDNAVQSTVIFGNVNASGELCVRIYDVGNVTDPIDYSISVVHP